MMMEIREISCRNNARDKRPDPLNWVERVVAPNLYALFLFIILLLAHFVIAVQPF